MIKLALVGTGQWGKNYIKAISKIKDCQLSPDYIKTHDYKDLLEKKEIDGVIIATPSSSHFEIAKVFIEKGYNVLIEKPLTTSLSDAIELKKVQQRLGKIVMVGHIYRYNLAFNILLKSLDKIGKIKFVVSEGMNFNPFRNDVSSLWDWAPHDISMASAILGKPISVCAWGVGEGKRYDASYCKIKFENKTIAFINNGWLSPIKKRDILVAGEKGVLFFDDILDKKLSLTSLDGKISHIDLPDMDPLQAEILEFLASIKEKRVPKTDIEEGIMTVRVLEAAEKSIENWGTEVDIL